jgi:hypothetical protein
LVLSPPESFEEANQTVEEAWKAAFPSLRFPAKFIGVFPREANKGVQDIQLGTGLVVLDVPNRYNLIVNSNLVCFRRERGLVTALKGVLDQKSNEQSRRKRLRTGMIMM